MNIVMRDTSFGVYIFNLKININPVIRILKQRSSNFLSRTPKPASESLNNSFLQSYKHPAESVFYILQDLASFCL